MGKLPGTEPQARRLSAEQSIRDDGLSAPAVADLARAGVAFRDHTYSAGSFIFRRGEVPAWVHLLCSGVVELSRHGPAHHVAVDLVRSGDVFGDVPLLSGMSEPFDAQALEESHVLSIPSGDFLRALQQRTPPVVEVAGGAGESPPAAAAGRAAR